MSIRYRSIISPLLIILLIASTGLRSLGVTIMLEDFEDASVNYTSFEHPSIPLADDLTDIGANDYFGRIPSPFTFPSAIVYLNYQGSGFYGAMDTDSANSGDVDIIHLIFSMDISGYTDLGFEMYVAEDDDGTNQDWDPDTSLKVERQIDGGGYVMLFAVESASATLVNQAPSVDTNFDGVGDGIEITDTFVNFTNSIPGTGSTLDLRITFSFLDAGDEDIAIDNVRVTGKPPAPSCTINAPANGASDASIVTFDYDINDPNSEPLDSTFEYSTNGGASWTPATSAGTGSAYSNPDLNRSTPAAGVTFDWVAGADLPHADNQLIDFRIVFDNGAYSSTCSVSGLILTTVPACGISSPSPGSSTRRNTELTCSATDPSGALLDTTFYYSTNGGGSLEVATSTSAGSIAANPDTARPAYTNLSFEWDALADIGLSGPVNVDFYMQVQNAYGGSATCIVSSLVVNNLPAETFQEYVTSLDLTGSQSLFDSDGDMDNVLNGYEWAAGTLANDSNSVPEFTITTSNSMVRVGFTRNTNALDTTIRLESADSLTTGVWTARADYTSGVWATSGMIDEAGSSSPKNVTFTEDGATVTSRYYRISVAKP